MTHAELWLTLGDERQRPMFRLDPQNHALWRLAEGEEDQRVQLMPRTFDLLHFLVRHPAHLVTHDALLEGVWGDEAVQPEVLKTHVHAIRQAVGDTGTRKRFIETERGRGYRFIGQVSRAPTPPLPTDIPGGARKLPGRHTALGVLESARVAADAGDARLVLVSGEAGIGKSALVEAFLNQATSRGSLLSASGYCIEGFAGHEPYYPFLEAVEALCRTAGSPEVARSVAALAPTWARQLTDAIPRTQLPELRNGLGSPEGMLREVLHLFKGLGQNHLLVIVIEDLHWSDHATLDALVALFGSRTKTRLLVVATYRTPEVADHGTPLQRAVSELAIRDCCVPVRLLPLEQRDVSEVLDASGRADHDLIGVLTAWSGGNPLFLRMTLAHLQAQGKLVETPSGWQRTVDAGHLIVDAPPPLADFIRSRVALMPESTRRLLEAASAYGARFCPAVLAPVTGLDSLGCEAACRSLLSTVLRDDTSPDSAPGTTAFSFQHVLYRHAIYEGIGPLRRQALHRQLAEAMEARHLEEGRTDVVLPMSRQFELAREWDRALHYAETAIQICDRRHARQDALAIVGNALRLTEQLPPQARVSRELRLLERQASLQAASHDASADASFEQIRLLGAREQDVEVQIKGLLGLAYTRSWHDAKASQACIEAALRLAEDLEDPVKRQLAVMGAHTRRIWTSGWDRVAAGACEHALATIQRSASPLQVAEALMMFGMLSVVSGHYTAACVYVTGAYREISEASTASFKPDLVRAAWMYHVGLPWALLYRGDITASAAAFERSLKLYRDRGDAAGFRSLTIYRSILAFHCLAYHDVIAANVPFIDGGASRHGRPAGNVLPVEYRIALIYSGLARAELRETRSAFELLCAAEDEMARRPAHLDWYWRLHLEWGLVGAFLPDDPAQARYRAERLVALASQTDEWTWRALALEALARAALAQDDIVCATARANEAMTLCQEREVPLARWRVMQARAAVARRSGDGLTAASLEEFAMAERRRIADAASSQDASTV